MRPTHHLLFPPFFWDQKALPAKKLLLKCMWGWGGWGGWGGGAGGGGGGGGGQERSPALHYDDPPSRAAAATHLSLNHKVPSKFQPKLQDGKRSENLLFFCPVPSHQNQEAILGEYQRGNWNYEFEANFLRPDFYTVVSQIRKSEMGLLRFLFYVAAINEFPAEYLSIIFFETIFRGERTQTWGIILKFK